MGMKQRIRSAAGMVASAWKISLYELRVLLFSGKFVCVLLLGWMFFDNYISGVRQFAMDYHLGLTPAQLPFYFTDIIYANIALLLIVFIFSDLPASGSGQRMVRQRCSRAEYEFGQMLCIFEIAMVYVVVQFALSVLVCLPQLSFDGWGKAWGSIANGTLTELGYSGAGNVSWDVINHYSALSAVIYSGILFSLTSICYGLFVYLFNRMSGGKLGTILVSVWSVMWIFFGGVQGETGEKLRQIAPQRWNDLRIRTAGEIPEVALRIGVIILIFVICNYFAGRRETVKRW